MLFFPQTGQTQPVGAANAAAVFSDLGWRWFAIFGTFCGLRGTVFLDPISDVLQQDQVQTLSRLVG